MSEDNKESLLKPLVKISEKVLSKTGKGFYKLFEAVCKPFSDLPNAGLYFCGFSLVLVPLIVTYWLIALAVLISELLILCLLGLILGLIFALIGVWAGPITAVGLTGISLIRLPQNLFYHAVVTHRTVLLRTNLKILSFLLLPIIHLLVPVFTFLLSLIFYSVKYFSLSFGGYPLKPWMKIPDNIKVGLKKFASDMDTFFTNYGDPSGIPDGWDGRVYGLPIDPVVFVISLIVYLIVLIPFSLVTFFIFVIKAIPIFLGTLTQFWKALNISASLAWYQKVLTGNDRSSNQSQSRAAGSERPTLQSGHDGWIKKFKKSTKFIVKFIENYSKIKPLHSYERKLKGYSSWVKPLKPSKLSKIISYYCEDFSPLKAIPSDIGVTILCLWIPILMTFIIWVLGLLLVLTVPPLSFLLALLAWLAGWLIVIPLWPLLYVAGWVFIIFGLPCLYLLVWVAILVCPWLLSILGALSGPIIALKVLIYIFVGLEDPICSQVPIFIITANFYNPMELGNSIKESFKLSLTLLRRVDKWTGSLSIGKFRLTNADNDTRTMKEVEREVLKNYWDLVVDSCIMARVEIVSLNWLDEDDIASASATRLLFSFI